MKCVCLILILLFTVTRSHSQANVLTKKSYIGLQFFYYDFNTAKLSQSTTLLNLIRQKNWTKPVKMQSGFGVFYTENFTKKIEASITMNAAWLDYPDKDYNYTLKNRFLLELSPVVHYKMFPNHFIVNPFVIAGVTIHQSSSRLGVLADVGLGTQFSLFNESNVISKIQYRHPLNHKVSGHFFYSIGISTLLKERKVVKNKKTIHEEKVNQVKVVIDSDKDGVADELDHCPDIVGIKELNGCPQPKREEVKNDSAKKEIIVQNQEQATIDSANNKMPDEKFIYFEFSSPDFIKKDSSFLNKVLSFLKTNPGIILHLYGHTDNVGSVEHNEKLSLKRCQSVKSYLIKKGIASTRIYIKGLGELKPLLPNTSKTNRDVNRRVEFVFK